LVGLTRPGRYEEKGTVGCFKGRRYKKRRGNQEPGARPGMIIFGLDQWGIKWD